MGPYNDSSVLERKIAKNFNSLAIGNVTTSLANFRLTTIYQKEESLKGPQNISPSPQFSPKRPVLVFHLWLRKIDYGATCVVGLIKRARRSPNIYFINY